MAQPDDPEKSEHSKAQEDKPKFPANPTWFDGYWQGGYTRGEYVMQIQLWSDDEGRVSGGGNDAAGIYVVTGDYDADRQRIKFFKHYNRGHVAQYNGFFDGEKINGFWFLGRQVGNFLLWTRQEMPLEQRTA